MNILKNINKPQQSLATTIHKVRPELLPNFDAVGAPAIPDTPPANFFDKTGNIVEGIGEPMNACFFVQTRIDPAKWY